MKLTIQTCGGQAIELTGAEARDVFKQLRALLEQPSAAPVYVPPEPYVPWQPVEITCAGGSITGTQYIFNDAETVTR